MPSRAGLVAATVAAGGIALVSQAWPQAQVPPVVAASATAWVTAWGTSQQVLGDERITNATVRMLARVTLPGSAVRVRLDNTFGAEPLVVGHAAVGVRVQGAALAIGSTQTLTFNGASGVTIPPGATAWSDRAALPVLAQQDIAISLYVPGAQVRPSQHTSAYTTSYRSADASGDFVGDESRTPFTQTTASFWWVKAIDVETTPATRAIVAFGDSITDGTCTTRDAHERWENLLSIRLGLAQASERPGAAWTSVVNEGIGGNTVTREGLTPPPDSATGLERFDRDMRSHHGVRDVVIFMGTNDIRRDATATRVIAGLADIAARVRAAGLRAIGVTIIPRHNIAPAQGNSGWNDAKTLIRRDVNQWIRSRGSFDGVIDFDQVIRDPDHPDLMQARFNCGDGIHPSPAGYFAMGQSVELALFRH